MALTRIDCFFFRGECANPESSSYVALDPLIKPGSLVLAGTNAARESVGGQVACRLALEHFVGGVLQYFEHPSEAVVSEEAQRAISLKVLENAFRSANGAVFELGKKLAAGGRMSASLIGMVIEEGTVAAARVGQGGAFLCREGQVFPFFDAESSRYDDPTVGAYIGVQPLVSVDLSSVPVQSHDVFFLFSRRPEIGSEKLLAELVAGWQRGEISAGANLAQRACEMLFPAPEEIEYALGAGVGPQTIYLEEVLPAEG